MDSIREQLIDEAKTIITSNRNKDYGEPEDNFERIADLWNAYLKHIALLRSTQSDKDVQTIMEHGLLLEHDTAVLMILMKVARIIESPQKADHWVDIIGYAACGGQCIVRTAD